jgi:2-keto-myo-inositol isomerase
LSGTTQPIGFGLNHMAAPQLNLRDFFALARRLGIPEVEIRNDIAGQGIADGTPAAEVKRLATNAGVRIATINALQRFNNWTADRARQARELIDYCRDCGAAALILVPTNDGAPATDGERARDLRQALEGLAPLLKGAGVLGLVEPLGFETCSLRSKREAAEAIADTGATGTFKITHDTFHHTLAGEPELFPELTGLVHISGVEDPAIAVRDMRDAHRVLVTRNDRIGNLAQIRALRQAGYAGLFSFEPFAAELRTLPDPAAAIRGSMEIITSEIAAAAA